MIEPTPGEIQLTKSFRQTKLQHNKKGHLEATHHGIVFYRRTKSLQIVTLGGYDPPRPFMARVNAFLKNAHFKRVKNWGDAVEAKNGDFEAVFNDDMVFDLEGNLL